MSRESRMFAGVLLVVLPTVMFGWVSLLSFLTRGEAGYVDKNCEVPSTLTRVF